MAKVIENLNRGEKIGNNLTPQVLLNHLLKAIFYSDQMGFHNKMSSSKIKEKNYKVF